jgi:hypothetical protein
MNAPPAKVAGVGEIVMVALMPGGARNPLVLAAAAVAGVDWCSRSAARRRSARSPTARDDSGGAQDHRPGHAYVASAKRRARHRRHRHDRRAERDPVLADGTTLADWVAMDLFSQAEHDELAQHPALPRSGVSRPGAEAIARLLPTMPRRDVIRACSQPRPGCGPADGRGLEISNRSPLSTSGSAAARALGAAAAPPGQSPRRLHQREPGRLPRRPNHVADRGHGPVLVAARRLRLPEGTSLIEVSEALPSRDRSRSSWPGRGPARPRRRGGNATDGTGRSRHVGGGEGRAVRSIACRPRRLRPPSASPR